MITTQLAVMTRSGMDLADAVRQLASQCRRERLRRSLEMIFQDLQEGRSFSSALVRQVKQYGESYVASVMAGESSGTLEAVLDRMRTLLRDDVRIRSSTRGAIMYPVILLGVSLVVVAAIVFFVLPQFASVFDSMETPVPLVTRIMLDIGAIVRGYWLPELVLCGGAIGMLVYAWNQPWFKGWRHRIVLENRVVGRGIRSLVAGRFFRLMGTMLASGVPLLEALRISRKAVNNSVYESAFQRVENSILDGGGMATILDDCRFLPDGCAEIVRTGERTGELASVLDMMGQFFEEEGEREIRQTVKLLEPAIIVVMGIIVATIVASVMLPLFDLSSASTYQS